jgi:hypothetical protein
MSLRKLPWLQIIVAVLAVIYVGYGLVQANLHHDIRAEGRAGRADKYWQEIFNQGWPLHAREVRELHGPFPFWRLAERTEVWYGLNAYTDTLTAVIMFVATVACGIFWRRPSASQFTLRSLFVLLTIVAGLLALIQLPVWKLPLHLIPAILLGYSAIVYWVCQVVLECARRIL